MGRASILLTKTPFYFSEKDYRLRSVCFFFWEITESVYASKNIFVNIIIRKIFILAEMPPVKHYSSSEVNQYELSSRLLSLTENNTSYTLTQINGQRIYRKAPHAWSGPEPSRNCEVTDFVFINLRWKCKYLFRYLQNRAFNEGTKRVFVVQLFCRANLSRTYF